jgi:hypothetical protein
MHLSGQLGRANWKSGRLADRSDAVCAAPIGLSLSLRERAVASCLVHDGKGSLREGGRSTSPLRQSQAFVARAHGETQNGCLAFPKTEPEVQQHVLERHVHLAVNEEREQVAERLMGVAHA